LPDLIRRVEEAANGGGAWDSMETSTRAA